MSVWYLCPSARPKEECLQAWLDFGARVMILRQGEPLGMRLVHEYPVDYYAGWAASNNNLMRTAQAADAGACWFVFGGDDYWPDPRTTANEVQFECNMHFGGTLGVMQPTGDRYNNGYIDTAAASPWIGEEFCQRAYQGRGPFFEDYHHFYADTELQKVAERANCFWQRPDIYQEHRHWQRGTAPIPSYVPEIYGATYYTAMALYHGRVMAGFPGSALL